MGFNWKRTLTISAAVILSQQLLKSFVDGLYPAVTSFGLIGLTVGGVVTAGVGVFVGEFVSEKWMNRK